MNVINLTHPHSFNANDLSPTVLALGYFDGVHLGHKKVITTAKKIADQRGYKSAVMTFHPHPAVVLRNSVEHGECITSIADKEEEIRKLGIDTLYIVQFCHSFAELLPQQFVDQYIIDLNVKHVVAGFDYTYGRLGKGTMETLPFHSREKFTQTVIDKVVEKNEKISSTLIRELIHEGNMQILPHYLGRYYTMHGKVIHGEKRGRLLGFPTANIELFAKYILPPTGVYAVRIFVNNRYYNGVLNIGFKPTFHDETKIKLAIEAHIFDFNESIYGEQVIIEWHQRLRQEQKFQSVEQLISQIHADKEDALRYFGAIRH
ncbi:bifunctional riboflavin kinase/FAD synthetase [Calidifontibacillus oryziterrae]|uniref:bifunctional riboflavin kinase/FAD synthetase n=1 Tax=Calidifontibacillus oryziterrae TaxID=1191699 RepID=UPI00031AA50B|nr:bifunctional riboflavin kinase/FAD synthetase [Calidifontibacillus oryziterrae]